MTRCTFGDTNVFFYFPNFDRNRGSHWMHFCLCMSHRISHVLLLQINWQPFYLRQLLKFHPLEMTRCTFGDTNVSFYFPNFDRNRGSHWMHFCLCMSHRISHVLLLQINWQPFYLRQLLKFHPLDWLIEIYLQTEGQGTHHKMISLQPMNVFFPLLLKHRSLF